MKIRSFNEIDTQSVIALWESSGLTRPWNNPQLDILRKQAMGDNLFLVVENKPDQGNETIIGSVMGGYDGHRGWINYLAVAPSHQRMGLGKQLMQEVQRRLLAIGCPKLIYKSDKTIAQLLNSTSESVSVMINASA